MPGTYRLEFRRETVALLKCSGRAVAQLGVIAARRGPLPVALLAAVVLAGAAHPPGAWGRRVTKATITVGRGANGATLDTTRRQVVAKLGRPIGHNGPDVLSYMRPADGLFDVYRYPDTGRVRMFISSPGLRRIGGTGGCATATGSSPRGASIAS